MNVGQKLFNLNQIAYEQFEQNMPFRPIDFAFAEFIQYIGTTGSPWLTHIAAYLSWQAGQQHSCVSLDEVEKLRFSEPLPDDWLAQMVKVGVVGQPDSHNLPIILSNNRLYLQRYWFYEHNLAEQVKRIEAFRPAIDLDLAKQVLDEAFESSSMTAPQPQVFDWQKNAVALSLINGFSVISGGPGTGKTTTVALLIIALQQYALKTTQKTINIKLAAPTGKAAARLSQSLLASLSSINEAQDWFSPCVTLHTLMGVRGHGRGFVHTAKNPLHLDMLIIDEASMVDLATMSKVLSAIPKYGRVLLLGDTHQLASVDVGNVLSDICQSEYLLNYSTGVRDKLHHLLGHTVPESIAPASVSPRVHKKFPSQNLINDRVAWLHKSYRFSDKSQIGQLASAFLSGNTNVAKQWLVKGNEDELCWHQHPDIGLLINRMMWHLDTYFESVRNGEISESLRKLAQFQVLSAHRKGLFGVNNINQKFEAALYQKGIIEDWAKPYAGKPVMITRNAPSLGLYNGDIGIYMPDEQNQQMLKVWFMLDSQVKGFLPARLPEFDTAYCLTVHKSQGSEYDRVILCLNESGALGMNSTRELLYTGLTRAKKVFELFASESTLQMSLKQRVRRASGVAERLD